MSSTDIRLRMAAAIMTGTLVVVIVASAWNLYRALEQTPTPGLLTSTRPPVVKGIPPAIGKPGEDIDIGELAARPPFDKSRRPPAPPPPPKPAAIPRAVVTPVRAPIVPRPVPPVPIVAGVIIDGTRRAVLLHAQPPGSPKLVRQGETFGGWIVDSITATSVRLRADNVRRDLPLFPVASPQPSQHPTPYAPFPRTHP